jgi:hypothetical protein
MKSNHSILCMMTSFVTDKLTNPSAFEGWWYRRDPTHVFFYSNHTMQYIASEILHMNCIFPEGSKNVVIFERRLSISPSPTFRQYIDVFQSPDGVLLLKSTTKRRALYVIGQISLLELSNFLSRHEGSILFVQGLPGFNVVKPNIEAKDTGGSSYIDVERDEVEEMCKAYKCTLFNFPAEECIRINLSEMNLIMENIIPNFIEGKKGLFRYREKSLGSFFGSTFRGKVVSKSGLCSDGFLRYIGVETSDVGFLKQLDINILKQAIACSKCRGVEDNSCLMAVIACVEKDESNTAEEYLQNRSRGFSSQELFHEMVVSYSNDLTRSILSLAACDSEASSDLVLPMSLPWEVPAYDDFTIHQSLRILSGLQPLTLNCKDIHLQFVKDCFSIVYSANGDFMSKISEYTSCLLNQVNGQYSHIVFHDIGSDPLPDDFPAIVLLVALNKVRIITVLPIVFLVTIPLSTELYVYSFHLLRLSCLLTISRYNCNIITALLNN